MVPVIPGAGSRCDEPSLLLCLTCSMPSAAVECWRRGHGNYRAGAASARREDSKEDRRPRTTPACSRLAPPGARSASIAERTACSDASVSAILAPSGECRRDLLAQGVQRLRQIIGAPLDIGPPGGRVGGGQPAGRFGDAHRVMQGRAFRIRIDEPGPPARRGSRAAARGAHDQCDQADQDKDAQQDPEPDQASAGGGGGGRGTAGRRGRRRRHGYGTTRLGGGGRRDAGPGRGGRGPARQAADRAADGPPASRRQQSGGKQGYREGKSFRRTPHADPSASCMADRWSLRCRRDRCRTCPDGLAARPCDLQAAELGGFCLRHHRDCTAPRLGSDLAISAPRSASPLYTYLSGQGVLRACVQGQDDRGPRSGRRARRRAAARILDAGTARGALVYLQRSAFGRCVALETSNTFTALAGGDVAVFAVRVRFFQRQGYDAAAAVSAIATTASWSVKGLLFLVAIPVRRGFVPGSAVFRRPPGRGLGHPGGHPRGRGRRRR